MKILWITNSLLPDIGQALGKKGGVSGGWMQTALNKILNNKECEIAIACCYPISKYTKKEIRSIKYYVLPYPVPVRYNKKLESLWKNIKSDFDPDIVHIHGTEFPVGLSYVRACGSNKVVVSIQGMISEIEKHKYDGISIRQLLTSYTFYDISHLKYLPFTAFAFYYRAKYERELLTKVKNAIGRTTWDRAHCKSINCNIRYFHLKELLRDAFETVKWNYDICEKHTIFVSQVYTPIKGLHYLVKAISYVKKEYPDVKVYVAGNDIINHSNKTLRGYGKICKKLMNLYDVEKSFEFVGMLDANQMAQYYVKANAYVCCSAIENSPNSLCEAQMVGTPVISSYVGGTPDFIDHGRTGYLYRSDDPEMLAYYICKVFDEKDNIELSKNEIATAVKRHSGADYVEQILNIYKQL